MSHNGSDVAVESAPSEVAADYTGNPEPVGGPVQKKSLLPEAPPPSSSESSKFLQWLWETEPPVYPLRLDPFSPWPKVRRFTPSFLTSALVQAALVFFLYTFPFALLLAWLMGPQPVKLSSHTELKVVKLDDLNIADFLPNYKSPGAAKAPGKAEKHPGHPQLGSSHFDPRITIVSNPPKPDNNLLTLKNQTVPPSPKRPEELQIPDVIAGGPKPKPEAPKTPVPVTPKVDTPKLEIPKPAEAPELKAEVPKSSSPPLDPLTPLPPKPLANPALMTPVAPHVTLSSTLPPPPIQLAAKLPDLPTPHLEVPMPAAPPKPAPAPTPAAQPAEGDPNSAAGGGPASKSADSAVPGGKASAATAAGPASAGGGPEILAISVNPVPLKDLSSIPGGVHNGQFSISPEGRLAGSPGGAPGGTPEAGEGGPGAGGDKSTAVGNGKGKPGGGGPGNPSGSAAGPSISISGPGGQTGNSVGTLPPLKASDLVYAVKPDTPKAKAPTMVVSGGSFGGGGLRVFGVLHGGKIYTVYFPMPGKSWILQYCLQEPPLQPTTDTRNVMIQMAPPLTPPAVIDQFDFHRPPQEAGTPNTMIILHGSITADGTVKDLSVIEGLDPISNEAATLAFSHWKFKAATRSGAPVALEILIGIP